jgi:glutaredoxin
MKKTVYLIYGISDCPACLRAQAVLMELDLEYVFIEMDFSRSYRESIKKELEWSTFPIIMIASQDGEELLGGFEDLIYTLEKETTTDT